MSKLFPDDPMQGDRAFDFFYGHCIVLPSTALVYIYAVVGLVLGLMSLWWLALSILSIALGLCMGKEKWRRVIAIAAIACLFIDGVRLAAWLLAFFLTSAIDGWQIKKRRNQLLGLPGWRNDT